MYLCFAVKDTEEYKHSCPHYEAKKSQLGIHNRLIPKTTPSNRTLALWLFWRGHHKYSQLLALLAIVSVESIDIREKISRKTLYPY